MTMAIIYEHIAGRHHIMIQTVLLLNPALIRAAYNTLACNTLACNTLTLPPHESSCCSECSRIDKIPHEGSHAVHSSDNRQQSQTPACDSYT